MKQTLSNLLVSLCLVVFFTAFIFGLCITLKKVEQNRKHLSSKTVQTNKK